MIYADYNGSAPLCPDVCKYLIKRLENGPFANPNAIHHLGNECMRGMENSRSICAKSMGAKPKQLFFNSGATEGLSQVFYSLLDEQEDRNKKYIIVSGIEHSAVLNLGQYYETKGYTCLILPAKSSGQIDLQALGAWVEEYGTNIALVAIMAANNETGVIQPYQEIGSLCQTKKIPYLCDTTQLIGKDHFSFKESNIDYAVMSGHKIGAMTGTGILIADDPTTLKPMIIGGGQEKSLRGGTQHYLGIETLAVAFKSFEEKCPKLEDLRAKRDEFEAKLCKEFPEIVVMGKDAPRLASTSFLSYPKVHGQAVQIELESQDIFVTTSSACSDNEPVTSKVLKAMGVTDDIGRGAVRISLGLCSDLNFYDKIYDALVKAYHKLSKVKVAQ